MNAPRRWQIAIPLFDGITALDAIGPYEVLQRVTGASVVFVGATPGVIRSDDGFLGLVVDATYEQVARPDVVVFPGGFGTSEVAADERVLDWVRRAHESTTFTTSVCTGAIVLAAAGLLDGLEATTHWRSLGLLGSFGAVPTTRRVVEHLDRRIITAAGVSSGIDMALRLAELLVDRAEAEGIQLSIEYDPQPPFDAGSSDRATDAAKARANAFTTRREQQRRERRRAEGLDAHPRTVDAGRGTLRT